MRKKNTPGSLLVFLKRVAFILDRDHLFITKHPTLCPSCVAAEPGDNGQAAIPYRFTSLSAPPGPRLSEQPQVIAQRKTSKRLLGLNLAHLKILLFLASLVLTGVATGITASAGSVNEIVTTLFGEGAQSVDIIILLTILTLLPSIVIMFTGFTRILIVLSFTRNALGMQQTPPNQVLIGLALFLTLFVMQPVFDRVYEEAYVPYTNGEIEQEEFIDTILVPAREFMFSQVIDTDMNFFIAVSGNEYDTEDDIPNTVLIPAFLTSEIKHAFWIGFIILIPFLVVDMIVASVLMSMGMMMLPPAMISLPFKVLLFVLVDGWQLVIGSLTESFFVR